jgi:hypothetical protein
MNPVPPSSSDHLDTVSILLRAFNLMNTDLQGESPELNGSRSAANPNVPNVIEGHTTPLGGSHTNFPSEGTPLKTALKKLLGDGSIESLSAIEMQALTQLVVSIDQDVSIRDWAEILKNAAATELREFARVVSKLADSLTADLDVPLRIAEFKRVIDSLGDSNGVAALVVRALSDAPKGLPQVHAAEERPEPFVHSGAKTEVVQISHANPPKLRITDDTPIKCIGFSTRTLNRFEKLSIANVGDLNRFVGQNVVNGTNYFYGQTGSISDLQVLRELSDYITWFGLKPGGKPDPSTCHVSLQYALSDLHVDSKTATDLKLRGAYTLRQVVEISEEGTKHNVEPYGLIASTTSNPITRMVFKFHALKEIGIEVLKGLNVASFIYALYTNNSIEKALGITLGIGNEQDHIKKINEGCNRLLWEAYGTSDEVFSDDSSNISPNTAADELLVKTDTATTSFAEEGHKPPSPQTEEIRAKPSIAMELSPQSINTILEESPCPPRTPQEWASLSEGLSRVVEVFHISEDEAVSWWIKDQTLTSIDYSTLSNSSSFEIGLFGMSTEAFRVLKSTFDPNKHTFSQYACLSVTACLPPEFSEVERNQLCTPRMVEAWCAAHSRGKLEEFADALKRANMVLSEQLETEWGIQWSDLHPSARGAVLSAGLNAGIDHLTEQEAFHKSAESFIKRVGCHYQSLRKEFMGNDGAHYSEPFLVLAFGSYSTPIENPTYQAVCKELSLKFIRAALVLEGAEGVNSRTKMLASAFLALGSDRSNDENDVLLHQGLTKEEKAILMSLSKRDAFPESLLPYAPLRQVFDLLADVSLSTQGSSNGFVPFYYGKEGDFQVSAPRHIRDFNSSLGSTAEGIFATAVKVFVQNAKVLERAPHLSFQDTALKADLTLVVANKEFDPSQSHVHSLPVQVKSSQNGASSHPPAVSPSDGIMIFGSPWSRSYKAPPVVVMNLKDLPTSLVTAFGALNLKCNASVGELEIFKGAVFAGMALHNSIISNIQHTGSYALETPHENGKDLQKPISYKLEVPAPTTQQISDKVKLFLRTAEERQGLDRLLEASGSATLLEFWHQCGILELSSHKHTISVANFNFPLDRYR